MHAPVGTNLADFYPELKISLWSTLLKKKKTQFNLGKQLCTHKIFSQKSVAAVDVVQKTKFNFGKHLCAHKLADFRPEEHLVVDLVQTEPSSTLACIQRWTCVHQIGRFLVRRACRRCTWASISASIKLADFWPEAEHRCSRRCSETKFNFSMRTAMHFYIHVCTKLADFWPEKHRCGRL